MRRHRFSSRRLMGKLAAYAASAAVLVASEAEAAIIHTDLSAHPASFVGEGEFNVDLNQDGTSDFQFVHEIKHQTIRRNCTSSSSGWSWCQTNGRRVSDSVVVRGLNNNGLVADGRGLALKLPKGMVISQAAHEEALLLKFTSFTERNTYGNSSGSHWTGNFQGEVLIHTSYGTTVSSEVLPSRGYLGMTFRIAGSVPQAAWADIEVLAWSPGRVSAIRMYGFAYETEPGKPILAGAVPEPPSLVLLAAGAAGLAALRRHRG